MSIDRQNFKQNVFPVCVRCFTFNHAGYIRETMNGFTMQQTSFPYVCVIVDDASTDGEPDIIKGYIQDNFVIDNNAINKKTDSDDYVLIYARHKINKNCYFAVFLMKYNHHSIKKSKMQYITDYLVQAKYHALCEGDDYWINQYKLQRQFDFMENHPDCTMTCTRAKLYLDTQNRFMGEQYCRKSDGYLNPVDVICRSGYYIATCSIVYRPWIKDNYPDYCHNCEVGDWPLQIMASMKGLVFYFDECMCVYRYMGKGSWSSNQKFGTIDSARLHIVCSQSEMFEGFSKDNSKYKNVFDDMNSYFVLTNIPNWNSKRADKRFYIEKFSHVINKLPLKFKPYYMVCKMRLPGLRIVYKALFLRKYKQRIYCYDGFFKRIFLRSLR